MAVTTEDIKKLREETQAPVMEVKHALEEAGGNAAEARQKGIPIVGIVDTNADPSKVNYPIPGNDDASAAISIIMETLADAVKK